MRQSRLYVNLYMLRVDSIRHRYQLIVPHRNGMRHVKVCVTEVLSCSYSHC